MINSTCSFLHSPLPAKFTCPVHTSVQTRIVLSGPVMVHTVKAFCLSRNYLSFFLFSSFFIFIYLLNLLVWHWSTRTYTFQEWVSLTRSVYCIACPPFKVKSCVTMSSFKPAIQPAYPQEDSLSGEILSHLALAALIACNTTWTQNILPWLWFILLCPVPPREDKPHWDKGLSF